VQEREATAHSIATDKLNENTESKATIAHNKQTGNSQAKMNFALCLKIQLRISSVH
jgi:hypothetical protein